MRQFGRGFKEFFARGPVLPRSGSRRVLWGPHQPCDEIDVPPSAVVFPEADDDEIEGGQDVEPLLGRSGGDHLASSRWHRVSPIPSSSCKATHIDGCSITHIPPRQMSRASSSTRRGLAWIPCSSLFRMIRMILLSSITTLA